MSKKDDKDSSDHEKYDTAMINKIDKGAAQAIRPERTKHSVENLQESLKARVELTDIKKEIENSTSPDEKAEIAPIAPKPQ